MTRIDRRWLVALLSAALGLAACTRDKEDEARAGIQETGEAPAADLGPGVNVDEQAQRRMGLAFATVGEAPGQAVAEGIATVLDSAALLSALDQIAAARSEVDSQTQNVRRLQQLYENGGNASLQALEGARAQLAAGRAQLTAAQSRARADWGNSIIDPADDTARTAIRDLRRGDGALLRAEFSSDLKNAAQLRYSAASAGEQMPVHFVGFSKAPTASTTGVAVTLAVPARESRDFALRPGARLSVLAAAMQGASQPLIPAGAAIADGGALWCYIERTPGRFDRIALDSEHRVAQGYPAPDAKVGARVVVRGAPLLLSLERSAGAPAADED